MLTEQIHTMLVIGCNICVCISACADGGNSSVRLMLKILTAIESIKETQSVHGKHLQQLLKQGSKPTEPSVLPASIKLPLTSTEEFEALNVQLQDNGIMTRLVSCFLFNITFAAFLNFGNRLSLVVIALFACC